MMAKIEHIEQIADGRAVARDIGITADNRIREIIAASAGQRSQVPIPLDKLQDRRVVRIRVADMTACGERRDNNQWNARAIPEKVNRLNVAGIVVTTAFVKGDDERSLRLSASLPLR